MRFFKVLMLLVVCVFPVFVYAQDVITLKSGDEIQAKVTEIGQTEVKYKRFDNPDGPTYTVNKSDIFMVKYQNGQKDVFTDEQPAQPAQNNVSASKENDDDGEFWKPYKWTNQRIAGISLFADLGGFCFTGSRYGLELRYRRWQVNGFFKYGTIALMNNLYFQDTGFPGIDPDIHSGYGGGFTVKFLFPLGESKSTLYVGVINEWANYDLSISEMGYSYVYYRETYRKMDETVDTGITGLGFGYSYHADNGFYFNVGTYLGVYVFNGYYVREDFNGNYINRRTGPDDWVLPFVTEEVTIGWEFCLYRKK